MNKKVVLENEVMTSWVALHRAHRMLFEQVETNLKLNKLPSIDWYDVLLELNRDKNNGLRQYEIGQKILLNKHNLSRLIDRLQNKQLVIRKACKEDKRGNRILITDKGIELLKKIWPFYSQSIKEGFSDKLEKKEFIELTRILNKLFS